MRIPADDVLELYSVVNGFTNPIEISPSGGFYTINAGSNGNINVDIIFKTGAFSLEMIGGDFFGAFFSPLSLVGTINQPQVYSDANFGTGRWRELAVEFPVESETVVVELIGEGNPVDVYFDNVRTRATQTAATSTVSAIAPVEGSGGGAEIYQTDTVLLSQTQDGQPLTAPAPDAQIQAADAGGPAVRAALAADGLGLFVWDQASGDYTGGYALASPVGRYAFACDPFLLFGDQAGNVYDSTGTNIGTAGGPVSYVSGDRRREAALLTVDNGLTRLVTREGGIIPLATLPQAAATGTPLNGHRTMNMDVGRCLGWRAGSRDLFWTDAAATGWKVAGAIREPIIRIVEYR